MPQLAQAAWPAVRRRAKVCFGQPRAASLGSVAQALTDSFLHEARPCKPCRKRTTAQGKASWPAGHLRASASPGPPQLSSPLYKQLRKTAGQSCRTSTNGQFFARSSPLQAVSQEKDSAGQSFVARGPPACFAQPRAASAKLAPIQSKLAQAAWPAIEKDCAGQSFVARGPPVCFDRPRAASAKLAPIQAASQDSRAKLSHKH